MQNRICKRMNNDWKFAYGDFFPQAGWDGFDDSDWYDTGIPHSFGIPYFMTNEFYVGYGCYRKKLEIDAAWMGKKIALEFQAVFQDAEIYINGKLAGKHQGGYTAFLVDITPYVKAGENLLFVRVNNLWNPRLAPRAGEHVFNGGIYRDVSLLVTETLHVAWYGTCVTTPEGTRDAAPVRIRTEVTNDSAVVEHCRLRTVLEGMEEVTKEREIAPGETAFFEQEFLVSQPRLWSPEEPNLYTVSSILEKDGEVCDRYETEFGIRWFVFTAEEGFFLNGAHYEILGANVHQDHAGWSDAVTHAGIRRDVEMIKECGMNFIRGSHYPHHTVFARECDRQGILFWSENCFWGTGGPKEEGYWTASGYPVKEEDQEEFEESCLRTLEEMIRANRNHPSIIVWSLCNEPFFSNIEVIGKAKALIRRLADAAHRLDPTRPAAVGGAQRGGFDSLADLAGYNGDGASIFPDPGFPNFVSEYGSTVEDRPGKGGPRYRDGVETDYAWRSGKALWCAFHHGSILADMGHMGMIDYYRLPLRTWYWYREKRRGIPHPADVPEGMPARLSLMSDRTRMGSDGTEDAFLTVALLDAEGKRVSAPCTVILEVTAGGGLFPTGRRFVFSPEKGNFAEGLGAVELRSWYAGEVVVQASSPGLEGSGLTLHVTGETPWKGQITKWQEPPYLTGAPEREKRYNIAPDRPVFCSSEAEAHPARNVTDAAGEDFWYPARQDAGEWLLVDLEGSKEMEEVTVVFTEVVNEAYEIALSDDREEFRTVYHSEGGDANSFLTVHLHGERARYVQLLFPNLPAAVLRMEIWV